MEFLLPRTHSENIFCSSVVVSRVSYSRPGRAIFVWRLSPLLRLPPLDPSSNQPRFCRRIIRSPLHSIGRLLYAPDSAYPGLDFLRFSLTTPRRLFPPEPYSLYLPIFSRKLSRPALPSPIFNLSTSRNFFLGCPPLVTSRFQTLLPF